MSSGWVKIHRRVLGWHLYGDIHCRLVFFHLLLQADRTGRVSISQGEIAEGCGLTRQETRTALGKMVESGEIEAVPGESRRAGTGYLIRKWSYYQGMQGDVIKSCNNQKINQKSNQINSSDNEGDNELQHHKTNQKNNQCICTRRVQEVQDSKESCPVLSARVREGQDDRTGQDILRSLAPESGETAGPDAVCVYPAAPEEISAMAKALGYWMSLPEAAEWLRMNQAYQWKGRDGEPIRTWKRLLRGYLRKSSFPRMEELEEEKRRQEAENARKRAILEEKRREQEEMRRREPKLDREAAAAFLLGSLTLPEALASAENSNAKKGNATDNATDNAEKTDERE